MLCGFFSFLSQSLDQDLWVAGDRSREEGVPSRFGRGTGMCPLIRLGNCGGKRETRLRVSGWLLSGKELQHCHCSAFLFFFFSFLFNFLFIVPLPFRLGNPKAPHQNEEFVYYLFKTLSTVLYLCVPEEMVSSVCVCFINEEQLSNQSTLFSLAPLGSNRKYSQDFLSLSQALKQDTSARPASKV